MRVNCIIFKANNDYKKYHQACKKQFSGNVLVIFKNHYLFNLISSARNVKKNLEIICQEAQYYY